MEKQIITITCNPAIDKTIYEDHTERNIGGKGINVSKVLKKMGTDSLCTGFLGKENGELVKDFLHEEGIEEHFISIEGRVRTNTKKIINQTLIEENEKGPDVSEEKIRELKDYLSSVHGQITVISGSAPSNVNEHFYEELTALLKENGNYVILDCDKKLLANGIKAHPDVIKPNIEELSYLYPEIKDTEDAIRIAKTLPVDLCILSMGGDGALFIKDKVRHCDALKVNYSSPVGAGDAMVAAAAYAAKKELSFEETITLCMAASAASVETDGSKAPEYDRIKALCEEVVIQDMGLLS